MLDLNHPQTPHIFRASGYIDKIKLGCRAYINQTFEERRLTFEKMRSDCEEMRAFCKIIFPEQFSNIKDSLKNIEIEIENLRLINDETESGKCKVCNGEIKSYKSRVKELPKIIFCSKCPENIYKFLLELEEQTGASWI